MSRLLFARCRNINNAIFARVERQCSSKTDDGNTANPSPSHSTSSIVRDAMGIEDEPVSDNELKSQVEPTRASPSLSTSSIVRDAMGIEDEPLSDNYLKSHSQVESIRSSPSHSTSSIVRDAMAIENEPLSDRELKSHSQVEPMRVSTLHSTSSIVRDAMAIEDEPLSDNELKSQSPDTQSQVDPMKGLEALEKSFSMFKRVDSQTQNREEESVPQTFAAMMRNCKLVQIGDPEGRVVVGTVFDTVGDDLYIDFGGKFHCVSQRPRGPTGRYDALHCTDSNRRARVLRHTSNSPS